MSFKGNDYIRLEKVAEVNSGPLSVGHWLEGRLLSDLKVLGGIRVLRDKRAPLNEGEPKEGVTCDGIFISSQILSVDTHSDYSLYYTSNSTWKATKLAD